MVVTDKTEVGMIVKVGGLNPLLAWKCGLKEFREAPVCMDL